MAILRDPERIAAWREFMQAPDGECAIVKADLRAAINAADAWVDAAASSFNAALPQPARGALTSKQKARLLTLVVQRRYGVES
jgi:hypothetical protein